MEDFVNARSTPVPVLIVAVLLLLLAGWRFVSNVIPAFHAGDPRISLELLNVILPFFLVWGLLTLRRWAWWLGLLGSAAGFILPFVLLGGFEPFRLEAVFPDFPDTKRLVQQLTLLGGVSFTMFALLVSGASRRAFQG